MAGTSCEPIENAKVICSGATVREIGDLLDLVAEGEAFREAEEAAYS